MSRKDYSETHGMSRRECLKVSALAAGGLAVLGSADAAAEAPVAESRLVPATTGPGHVVAVHKKGLVTGRFPNPEAAREAVHTAVKTLCGKSDLAAAYGTFVRPDDRVGIKINVLGGRMASTMKEVVDPIVEGVRAAGVPDENIMIFDQFGGNMRGARFGWQEKPGQLRIINHAVLGYEDKTTVTPGGGQGKLAKTLLWTTAVINVPLIKDHDLCGITCAIKNMVYGCVERPAMMHTAYATALPHFYAHDAIRSRVRLTIADGSFCLYDGGPKHNPKATAVHDTIYATTDPVAMDCICAEVVERYRAENKLRPLASVRRPVVHLALSEQLGLGIGDRERIRLETVEL